MTTTAVDPVRGTFVTGSLFEEVPALANLDPANPYPAYASIFGAPILVGRGDVAVVTRYAECSDLLRHPKVMNRHEKAPAFRGMTSSFMHSLDPPEHTRVRSVVNKALTRRSVDRLAPWLESEVHRLLDQASGATTFDVLGGLAYPLPLNAICQMLDVPLDDRDAIVGWSKPITYGLDPLSGIPARADQKANRSALRDFRRYIQGLTEQRRRTPGDDLLSRLILAGQTSDPLTDREIALAAMLLLIAGHETTVSTIGHGALALARHPELAQDLAGDAALADAFVEEVLRYDSPVQVIWRVAAEDLTIGERKIPAGCALLLLLGAANRDPEQFANPDQFDIGRINNRTHLAFGGGPHFCPGATLARLESRLALSAMAQRLMSPRLEADGVQYRKGVMMRGHARLTLEVDAVRPRVHTSS